MRSLAGSGIVAAAVAADQVSKYLVERMLPLQQPVDVLPFLALYRTYNRGIAFSMLNFVGDRFLIVLTLAILVLVGYFWTRTETHQVLIRLGLALIVGGALGNLIDRTAYGHVIDFVLLHAGDWSFAVFNLADSLITVGAGLILLGELLPWRKNGKA
jgi:signal peptidase II